MAKSYFSAPQKHGAATFNQKLFTHTDTQAESHRQLFTTCLAFVIVFLDFYMFKEEIKFL